MEDLKEEVNVIYPQLINWRRHFHKFPELSFREYKTSDFIFNQLRKFNLKPVRPTRTGVVVDIRGNGKGITRAFRADIDALPVQEQTDLSFKSENAGIMHACGHDGHIAILLGVAKLLSSNRNWFNGIIRLIFQPAEEVGGSRKLLDTGVLNDIDTGFALHLWSKLPVKSYGIKSGPLMAAGESFDVEVTGIGGHAGAPHLAKNPISIVLNIINILNDYLNTGINPNSRKVVSITYVHSGKANNVIPNEAKFGGTIRALDTNTLKIIKNNLNLILEKVTQALKVSFKLHFETDNLPEGTVPSLPVINDPELLNPVIESLREDVHDIQLKSFVPTMASEDFALYRHYIPTIFILVGAGFKNEKNNYPQHSAKFTLNELSLKYGLLLFLSIIRGTNNTKKWMDLLKQCS